LDKQFEQFVKECEQELFQTEKFQAIGKGEDYIFQSLAHLGEGSHKLSVATTLLSQLNEVPSELKEELKSIQQMLHDFKEKLRKI
jgi:hypothetical protein